MIELPYVLRRNQHRIGKAGRKSEKRVAKELGAVERPASGAMPGAKGDMELRRALVEAKSTTGNSISVSLDWLCKIAREARSDGKTPALTVSYVDDDGRPRQDGDWVLIPLYAFKELFCAEEAS
jgi:hypothetical protein